MDERKIEKSLHGDQMTFKAFQVPIILRKKLLVIFDKLLRVNETGSTTSLFFIRLSGLLPLRSLVEFLA
ncbi:CLUMA_CG018753, isoform A [Clunio marinus]|uniref:CLUMA_CG018753, isoform A n=1 Tax=Clunio marinus TaxID=568069 RepID=A0A1J1IZN6_9DIPT|nr:CLUMA_CG018753, isoform A [Clunio marinus]